MSKLKSFKHAGLDCVLCDAPFDGAINGYVAVGKDHVLFGVGYSDESASLKELLEKRKKGPMPETPGLGLMLQILSGKLSPTPECALEVHGGITYANNRYPKSEDRSQWWFGFDTLHAGDGPHTRTIEYVSGECQNLAQQLVDLQINYLKLKASTPEIVENKEV